MAALGQKHDTPMNIQYSAKWFIEHPFWTFIGSVLGIIGIFVTVYSWVADPIDPALKEMEVLLGDAIEEAAFIAQFSSYSDEQINSMLGKRQGWESSISSRIDYALETVATIKSHQAFSALSDHGRRAFNKATSKLGKYKDPKLMGARKAAVKQHACGLAMISIREIANFNEQSELVGCFPITPPCQKKLFDYGRSIGIGVSECEA